MCAHICTARLTSPFTGRSTGSKKKGGSLAGDPHGNDIRLRILIWDKNNNLMSTPSDGPDVYLYEQYAAEFAPAHVHFMETIKVAGHYFRTYTVKDMMQNEDVKIQFLAQIDGEVLMLHKLMIITIAPACLRCSPGWCWRNGH